MLKIKDAGIALTLIFVFLGFGEQINMFTFGAFVVLLILLIYPAALAPFSAFWYGASEFLGKYVSKVILTIIYSLVFTPVGFIVKNLKEAPFTKAVKTSSNFNNRNITYKASDIIHPY